jgi:hypothetical protein
MMAQGERQARLAGWLILGGTLACLWCSAFSGVAGWLLGQDLGWRAGRNEGRAQAQAALLAEAGVLVIRVDRDGPADQAGVRRDDLIVALDGAAVDDIRALRDLLLDYSPGDEVQLSVRRGDQERRLPVLLGRLPGAERPYLGIYYTARAEEPADL